MKIDGHVNEGLKNTLQENKPLAQWFPVGGTNIFLLFFSSTQKENWKMQRERGKKKVFSPLKIFSLALQIAIL